MILVINCGSSSVKYKLFSLGGFKLILKDNVENIGDPCECKNHHHAIKKIFADIKNAGIELKKIKGIGHRVVHGGENFKQPVVINKKVIDEIRKDIKLAPLHNPVNLEGILACRKLLPGGSQVAVFDTAFHQTIPDYAFLYGIDYKFYKRDKIRRYGFHGTSHQYVAQQAALKLKKKLKQLKLITVHLGNGCSLSAIDKGRSVDTSMGFTPLEGLLMGTRCGDIDPAIIFYLARQLNMSIDEVDKILNKKSGLLGISGLSNDMRKIKRAARSQNKRCKLALEMFKYRLKKYIGAYLYVMGGCDAIVFTAGIGENNPDIVKSVTSHIGKFLKIKPKVLVIPTDEELMIARLSDQALSK